MSEVAVVQAALNYELEVHTAHIPGDMNVLADALSRLEEPGAPKQFPEALTNIDRSECPQRNEQWWTTDITTMAPSGTDLLTKIAAIQKKARGVTGAAESQA